MCFPVTTTKSVYFEVIYLMTFLGLMKAIKFRTVLLELILYELYIATGEQIRLELVFKHDESLQSKCYLARMKAKGHTNDDHKKNVTKKPLSYGRPVAWCPRPPKKKGGGWGWAGADVVESRRVCGCAPRSITKFDVLLASPTL